MAFSHKSPKTIIKNLRHSWLPKHCLLFPVENFPWEVFSPSNLRSIFSQISYRHSVKILLRFSMKLAIWSKFEANLQNSSGRPVESYWTSSRIYRTSNRSSTGRPLDHMIWANMTDYYMVENPLVGLLCVGWKLKKNQGLAKGLW